MFYIKAMMVTADGALNWTDVPHPQIKDDEVLIKVAAAAVNRADLLQRAGNYPPPPGSPEWLGLELSGTIHAVGARVAQEARWHIGDQVCALMSGGAYAEWAAVPQGMLLPIPKGISLIEAAAIPEAFGASYLFLFEEANLKPGGTVLVTAGASGLASVLIPMAKAFGARVLTTVLSDRIAQSIKHLNADLVVDTSKQNLADVMKEELDAGHGVDIAIDCLGGETASECLPFMNRGGRWIMIATLAGDISPVNLKTMYIRSTRLIGTTLRSRTPEQKARLLSELVEHVWPKIELGAIRPTIYKVLPMTQAEEAHTLMREGRSIGKLVMTL
ncbi:NAD(P)H quinone oxidoreductase [Clostridia bacterium]|nr:NAD(P)H quinone oxidoreductase [Clostridia bacterium]